MNTRPGFAVEAARQTAPGQRSPKAGERGETGDNGFRDVLAERAANHTASQQRRATPGTHALRRTPGTNDKAGDDGQNQPRAATLTRAKHAPDARTAGRETRRPTAGNGDRQKTKEDHAGPSEAAPVATTPPAQPAADPPARRVRPIAANDRNDARRVDADTRSLRDRQRTDGTADKTTPHPERQTQTAAEPRDARISGPANPVTAETGAQATAETRAMAARADAGHARRSKASASNASSRAETGRSVADLDRHTAAAWDKAVFDAGARLRSDVAKSTLANLTVQISKGKAGTANDLASSLGHSFQTHAALQPAAPSTAGASQTPAVAAPAVVTASLYAAPGTEQWSRAITQQSLRLAHQAGGQAELTLHPPSLGKLQVSVQMGHDAQLHFASPHADVRAAVQSALPQLKDAFAEAGLALGQASVGDQNPGQSNADQQNEGAKRAGAIGADTETGEPVPDVVQLTRIVGRTTLGGIDIFA